MLEYDSLTLWDFDKDGVIHDMYSITTKYNFTVFYINLSKFDYMIHNMLLENTNVNAQKLIMDYIGTFSTNLFFDHYMFCSSFEYVNNRVIHVYTCKYISKYFRIIVRPEMNFYNILSKRSIDHSHYYSNDLFNEQVIRYKSPFDGPYGIPSSQAFSTGIPHILSYVSFFNKWIYDNKGIKDFFDTTKQNNNIHTTSSIVNHKRSYITTYKSHDAIVDMTTRTINCPQTLWYVILNLKFIITSLLLNELELDC